MWGRLSDALSPWYEQLAAEANAGAVLHADEADSASPPLARQRQNLLALVLHQSDANLLSH